MDMRTGMHRIHRNVAAVKSAVEYVRDAHPVSLPRSQIAPRIHREGALMKTADFLSIRWSEAEGPLIEPPGLSPIIADPSFLFPEESPDGQWQLFAHSAFGIHRYSSSDGLAWKHRGMAIKNAMRAFIRPLSGGGYALYYESYPPFALLATALPIRSKWKSKIAMCESPDLANWSCGRTIILPEEGWARDEALGASVSNPCLIQAGGKWRLYFSASLVWIEDCGFCEPLHLAMVTGDSLHGPFTFPEKPLPMPRTEAGETGFDTNVIGQGSLKVLPMEDGYVGLQNKIYRDPAGASRSAIFLLKSDDGIAWQPARPEPLIAPSHGWTRSHIYACDCRLDESHGTAYIYFNARDGWRINQGKERIGRVVGKF